ncbi:MAG: hypothetical protein GY762_13925 [Proteobacteria bacterium]|nr:hypothetical protein [Pseudomonadota bacterium]
MVTKDEIDQAVAELETSLERLSALYNQYFIGIEKTEPTIQRNNVDRKIRVLRRLQINNTALRFRLQTQIQKYNTQTTYWRRVCKQIEEGTYQRHVMRAKRRQEDRAQLESGLLDEPTRTSNPPPVYELDMDEPFADGPTTGFDLRTPMDSLDDPFAEAPPAPPQANKKKDKPEERASQKTPPKAPDDLEEFFSRTSLTPPPPPAATKSTAAKPGKSRKRPTPPITDKSDRAAHLEQERVKKLYRTYVAAKKRCNESTATVSMEKLERSLNKQYQSKGGNVDFQVVIRGGKAVIKTVKKKD